MSYSQTNIRVLRVALKYQKSSAARWLSHLDLIRSLELAIRRSGVPVAYSQGFNPRPRLSFGPPLPLGATSDGEVLILRMAEPIDPHELKSRLNSQMPVGIEVLEASPVAEGEPGMPAIQGATYLVRVAVRCPESGATLQKAVADFLAQNKVIVKRVDKGMNKQVDIRSTVESLEVVETHGSDCLLRLRVSHAGQQIARPTEVVQALSQPACEIQLVSLHREMFY